MGSNALPVAPSPDGMTRDELERRARRLVDEGFTHGDMGVFDELMAPDVVEHQRGNPAGVEGTKATVRTLHRWLSGFSLTIEDLVVDGDTVWLRNRARGTHAGSIMGHPATGRLVEVDVFDVMRFEDGSVVEHWGVADQVGLLGQIGALSAPSGRPAS
jgi:predicted ester cyclase